MKAIIVVLVSVVCSSRASPYHPYFYGFNPYAAFPWHYPIPAPAPQAPFSGTYSYHDGHKPTVVQANNDGYKFPTALLAALKAAGPTVVQANHHVVPAAVPVAPVPPPVIAPPIPFSGTYSYHDGHKPTVVQANNDGYKFPTALLAALKAAGPTVVQANHHVVPAAVPVAPAPPIPFSGTYSYHDGHRPTVVQANNEGYKFPTAASKLYAAWSHPWNPWSKVAPVTAAYHVPVVPHKAVVNLVDPWNYGAYYGTGVYGFGFSNYAPGVTPLVVG